MEKGLAYGYQFGGRDLDAGEFYPAFKQHFFGRAPIEFPEAVDGPPNGLFMLVSKQLTAGFFAEERKHAVMLAAELPINMGQTFEDNNLQAHFFHGFPYEAFGGAFSGFAFSTGKFPFKRQGHAGRALSRQDAIVFNDYATGYKNHGRENNIFTLSAKDLLKN